MSTNSKKSKSTKKSESRKKSGKRVGTVTRSIALAVYAVQLIVAALLIIELNRFPFLPARHMAIVYGVLGFGAIVNLILLVLRKGRNGITVGIILAIIWISGCILALAYLVPARKTVKKVTGQEPSETYRIEGVSVLVRADDKAQRIEDTGGYAYAIQTAEEYASVRAAYDHIVKSYNVNLSLKEYPYYQDAASALLSGEVSAMIADTSYLVLLEEYVPGFAGNYRILGDLSFYTDLPRNTLPDGITVTPSLTPTEGQPITYAPTVTPDPNVTVTPDPNPPVTPDPGNVTPTPTGKTPQGPTKVPNTPTPVITQAPLPDRENEGDITKEYFTVYFSGIDQYGSITGRSRSDVNIVMTVNPTTHRVLLVTIPRDAYVTIPGVSGANYDKLTHAGIYGVKASMNTLERVYGIKLDYYVRVNFSSVQKFVDLLGGVDVYCSIAFSTGNYSYAKGMNHMNGAKALAFARERHALAAGDFQRGRNQMELIKGVINKMQTPAVLNNFTGIMNTVSGNVQTSISMDQLAALCRMQLDTGASWTVDTYAVSASGGYEYCYSYKGTKLYVAYLNWNSVREASNLMRNVMAGQ